MCLLLGAMGYTIYMGCHIYVVDFVLVIGAFFNGVGAALLWSSVGAFVTNWSHPDDLGKNNGIFFGIFQVNLLIGNLLIGILFSVENNIDILWIYLGFTIIALVSSISFAFQKNPPVDDIEEGKKKLSEKIFATAALFKDKRMLLLIVIIIFSGLSQSFFYGVFTKLLSSVGGKSLLGFVMAVFGVSDAIGSFLIGKISDVVGRIPIVICGTILLSSSSAILLIVGIEEMHKYIYTIYIMAIVFGLCDSMFYVSLTSTLGTFFPDDSTAAFSGFRFIQALSTALNFFFSPYLNLTLIISILNGFLIIGTTLFIISLKFHDLMHPKGSVIIQ
eukprot:TRINITY_DN2140_c0_g1_i4.p1 TRINITY_DN2140_c0_g1~~TRINITY_DN2140_c0_g1_i4.p1  ORF type:complete len:331 (-),score=57.15 TRINITY_DN2140_c0_g1_i4:21-1013(-)